MFHCRSLEGNERPTSIWRRPTARVFARLHRQVRNKWGCAGRKGRFRAERRRLGPARRTDNDGRAVCLALSSDKPKNLMTKPM